MVEQLIVNAIQKMNGTADNAEQLRIAVSALQTLGWRNAVILVYESAARLVVATPMGIIVTGKPDDIAAWQLDKIPLSERAITRPIIRYDGKLSGLIQLENPRNDDLLGADARQNVELMAMAVANTIEMRAMQGVLQQTREQLTEQVDELRMMQSMDEELSSSLNLENVMMLATDWALRRTGARVVLLSVTTRDGMALYPLIALGFPRGTLRYNEANPVSVEQGISGRAARLRQTVVVPDVSLDPDYIMLLPQIRSQVAAPLEMQGRLLGVLTLASERLNHFTITEVEFINRLAARAAVALDNARLYAEAKRRAEESAALYTAGRAISSTLDRDEILPRMAQSIALVVGVSGALITNYRSDRQTAKVLTSYRVPVPDVEDATLPALNTLLDLNLLSAIQEAVDTGKLITLSLAQPDLGSLEREFMHAWQIEAALVMPMAVGDETSGIAFAIETRPGYRFTPEQQTVFEALISQAAVAFRQTKLYEEVRELENLKSEMIRMASHDLRNPLGNVLGYIDLINVTLSAKMTEDDKEYIHYMKKSATTMKSIIDDLLTLEKIESERQQSWATVDFGITVSEIMESQQASAELKHQALSLEFDANQTALRVVGSATQLRQGAVNLISNAIKYTPDNGRVVVRLRADGSRILFEVEDNGYGISADRQKRLFQRFYRAKQPGTEEIPGTGLGLSMVKTVIERHGGEVWVRSQEGKGSTFGFWLPTAESIIASLRTAARSGTKAVTDG